MLPALAAFAIWIAYGVWRARNARALRDKALQIPRTKRLGMGVLMLLLSLPLGLGPMGAAMVLSAGRPTLLGWVLAVAGGLLLIHFQMVGVTALVASAIEDRVTERRGETSLEESSPE